MKYLQKYSVPLLVLSLVVLLCAGCKNEETTDVSETGFSAATEPHDTETTPPEQPTQVPSTTAPTQTEAVETSPSLEQVAQDLLYLECNYFRLSGVDTCLDIKEIQLEDIGKNILGDVFRYSVLYGNEFYEVDAVYDMVYIYDSDCWVYFSCNTVSNNSRAIKSQINQNKLIEYCERDFDSYTIGEHTYWIDENGVFTDVIQFKGTLESKYYTQVFDGSYIYSFKNNQWCTDWDITPQAVDWSFVKGTWKLEHYDEFVTITIEDIVQTKQKITVTYSYETSPWYDEGPWEGYFNTDCDGSSRKETGLQRTCDLSLVSVDLAGGSKYSGITYKCINRYSFTLPIAVGGWEDDWNDGYFTLCFDSEKGFYISKFKYLYKNPDHADPYSGSSHWRYDANETSAYLKKVIDWDSVQNAFDQLEEMNP